MKSTIIDKGLKLKNNSSIAPKISLLRKIFISNAIIIISIFLLSNPALASTVFSENFESDLSQFSIVGNAQIVVDPMDTNNHAVNFSDTKSGGDLFSNDIAITPDETYILSFKYLGYPTNGNDLGGFIGITDFWVAGTTDGYAPIHLIDDNEWHDYSYEFVAGTSLKIMLEDLQGIPGDAYFDDIIVMEKTSEITSDIPEFPTIVLPIAAILGLAFIFQRRKEEE